MAVPNLFHGSKCRVVFSNVPTLTSMLNINLYDLYVKQVQIPSYNVLEYYSEFKGERKIHPISRQNTELQQLSIIFKCDEELANYFNLFEYLSSFEDFSVVEGVSMAPLRRMLMAAFRSASISIPQFKHLNFSLERLSL